MNEHIGFLVHDVARSMRRLFDDQMARHGLTRAQWWVLIYVKFNEGLTQRELAAILDLSPASMGAALKRLELKGRIRRVSDPKDSRSRLVYLNEEHGDEISEEIKTSAESLMSSILQDLSFHERNELVSALRKIQMRMAAMSKFGSPT